MSRIIWYNDSFRRIDAWGVRRLMVARRKVGSNETHTGTTHADGTAVNRQYFLRHDKPIWCGCPMLQRERRCRDQSSLEARTRKAATSSGTLTNTEQKTGGEKPSVIRSRRANDEPHNDRRRECSTQRCSELHRFLELNDTTIRSRDNAVRTHQKGYNNTNNQ